MLMCEWENWSADRCWFFMYWYVDGRRCPSGELHSQDGTYGKSGVSVVGLGSMKSVNPRWVRQLSGWPFHK